MAKTSSERKKARRRLEERHPSLSQDELDRFHGMLRIDKHGLDEMVTTQPGLYDEVAERASLATSVRDKAKQAMEEKAAEVGLDLRGSQGSKPTEAAIKESVALDGGYRRAVNEHLAARSLAARWDSLKNAFEQRSSMLKLMVQLYASNYFTVGAVKRDPGAQDARYSGQRKRLADNRKKRSGRHGEEA